MAKLEIMASGKLLRFLGDSRQVSLVWWPSEDVGPGCGVVFIVLKISGVHSWQRDWFLSV